MLVGQNGILSRAQETNGTNAYTSAVEQAKLAYMAVKTEIMTQKVSNSSYDATKNAGKLGKTVKQDLSGSEWGITLNGTAVTTETSDLTEGKIIKMKYTNSSLRAGMVDGNKPTFDGCIEFEIGLEEQDAKLSVDGGLVVKDSTGKAIDLATIATHYGDTVKYKGEDYQLFYVDTAGKYSNGEPRIWLQYKTYVSGVNLSDHYNDGGDQISNANSVLWQVNPDLNSKYGSTIRGIATGSLNNNIKGVAYLCNTANWNSKYVVSGDIAKGAYAIGGVSAEMFCDSYNQARGTTSTDADYFETKAFNENNTYGYRYKPSHANASPNSEGYGYYTDTTKYQILATTNKGIYRTSGWQWLASPSARGTSDVCVVYDRLSYSGGTTRSYGVRPAVSLPSNIQIQLTN